MTQNAEKFSPVQQELNNIWQPEEELKEYIQTKQAYYENRIHSSNLIKKMYYDLDSIVSLLSYPSMVNSYLEHLLKSYEALADHFRRINEGTDLMRVIGFKEVIQHVIYLTS